MMRAPKHPMFPGKAIAHKKKQDTFSCLVVVVSALLLLLLSLPGPVEASGTELVHAYGINGAGEFARCVIEHSIDQGFVFAGYYLESTGGANILLVKTNFIGEELWTKTLGGAGDDYAFSVTEHSIDNGLALTGYTTSSGAGAKDIILVKTNTVGVVLWTKTYGGYQHDIGCSVIEHSVDQGFVVFGGTLAFGAGNQDFILVKTNSVGVEQWTKTYGGSGFEGAPFGQSIIEHSIDLGFVLTGQTSSFSVFKHVMLVKTSSTGVELWTKTYGGTGTDKGNSVIEHSIDTGFVIAGQTDTYGAGGDDFVLIKTNFVGAEQWTKTYGGAGDDVAESVVEHSLDNGLVLAGRTNSFGAGSWDVMLVRTNSVGVELWTKSFGGSSDDQAYSVIEHSIDKGLVIAGKTQSFGVGSLDLLLVIQPSGGSGTAGAAQTPTEGTHTFTEGNQAITEGVQTLMEGDVTLTEVDRAPTTTVVNANPTPSQSPSQTASPSLSQAASSTASRTSTASASVSPSGTSAVSASASPSGTSAASQTAAASSSQTASRTASQTTALIPSASASASANVGDPCDDNECAINSTCAVMGSANQYTCDCTAISTADVRAVGRFCNATIEGKPVSVSGGNCPGCESAFVCTDSHSGDDPNTFMESVIPSLAGAFCGCANPPQALLDLFGAVQYQVQDDGSLCMEFTIYSGNPNATAADIVRELEDAPPATFSVQTTRPQNLKACKNEVDGCNAEGSGDNSLLLTLIGVSVAFALLLLGIAWHCIHKRVGEQYKYQNEVSTTVNEVVVEKLQADMAAPAATEHDSKSIGNELRNSAPVYEERLSGLRFSNNINVPTAAASTGPRYSAFTKSVDTAALEDDFEY